MNAYIVVLTETGYLDEIHNVSKVEVDSGGTLYIYKYDSLNTIYAKGRWKEVRYQD